MLINKRIWLTPIRRWLWEEFISFVSLPDNHYSWNSYNLHSVVSYIIHTIICLRYLIYPLDIFLGIKGFKVWRFMTEFSMALELSRVLKVLLPKTQSHRSWARPCWKSRRTSEAEIRCKPWYLDMHYNNIPMWSIRQWGWDIWLQQIQEKYKFKPIT